MLFYHFQNKKWNVLPQMGVRYDYSLNDYDNFQRKWLNEQSGGHILSAVGCIQAFYNKWGVKFTFTFPTAQNYVGGKVKAGLSRARKKMK